MSYRFTCRHCGSRFSLEQQLEEHEKECAKVDASTPKKEKKPSGQIIQCKHCPEIFENFGEYGRHRWAAHREQELAAQAEARRLRKADEAKIDAGVGTPGNGKSGRGTKSRLSSGPADSATTGPTCPTCGGALPPTTMQLVSELTAAGIPEVQAFEAARIARRVLGAAGVG